MCKAQAIIDELVSIGQGNRKDSGSTKGVQVGNKRRNVLYLSAAIFTLCLWTFQLAHGILLKNIAIDNVMMM